MKTSNKRKHLDDRLNYEGFPIERMTCYKLISVQFDQHLDWKQHFDKISKAVNGKFQKLSTAS